MSEKLTYSDLKNLSVEEVNRRWEEVQKVMSAGPGSSLSEEDQILFEQLEDDDENDPLRSPELLKAHFESLSPRQAHKYFVEHRDAINALMEGGDSAA
jgi:hypothetical protein